MTPEPTQRFPRPLLYLLIAVGLYWAVGWIRPTRGPLSRGDQIKWIQTMEGQGKDLGAGVQVRAVRGDWILVRSQDGGDDRWMRLDEVRSFTVPR